MLRVRVDPTEMLAQDGGEQESARCGTPSDLSHLETSDPGVARSLPQVAEVRAIVHREIDCHVRLRHVPG